MRTAADDEPTRSQLLAMAYVDGELDATERWEFEDRLRREPELMREVFEQTAVGLFVRMIFCAVQAKGTRGLSWSAPQESRESDQSR